jgi:DNA-binding transcriptional MerR regulator/effector-binding domain-containing protein
MLRIGDFSRLAQVSIKTLRYYDDMGLLKPAVVDRFTGYRYYTLDQLPHIHRILALKDLGLALDQIARLLADDLSAEAIHEMLRLKRAELQQHITESQAKLMRLEMRLNHIAREAKMSDDAVIIKKVEAQQVVSVRQIVPAIADVPRLFAEVRAAWQQFQPSGSWMALYHHAGYRDHDLDVEFAMPVAAPVSVPMILSEGRAMKMRTIPAIAMAVTILAQGNSAELANAYTALNTYIHEHNYNYLGPARQIYLRGANDTSNPAEYLTEIQYPVGAFTPETVVDGLELPADWQDSNPYLPLSRRAKTALEFARLEAVALNWHEITPAHVLLGLLRDTDGFAGHVLTDAGITLEQLRSLTPRGQNQSAQPPVSNAARQIIVYAQVEAQQLGHDYIGTEHLLLGLLRQSESGVVALLIANGVTPQQIHAAVMQTVKR